MRIAVLTQIAPNPPDAGPKVKTHFTLRTLAARHEVELITFARTPAEVAAARELETFCARVTVVPFARSKLREPAYLARGWLGGDPFLVARDHRSAFARTVAERLAMGVLDAVYADQVSMAQYLPAVRTPAAPHTIFDAHNAVWELLRSVAPQQPTLAHRAAAAVEWRLMRRFEGRICRTADLTFAVSEGDRAALERAAGTEFPSAVVPIGIEAREIDPVEVRADATRLLSVATLHYPPNAQAIRWFRDAIWPLVRRTIPAAHVDVVGTRPPDDLVRWGAEDEHVAVHGYLPDAELTPLFNDALAVIVPLQVGSGVRVKILEAMARGVPVVSTSIGAEGLDVVAGEHLLIADTPETFSAAIQRLCNDVALRRRLASEARARVLDLYDWRVCAPKVLEAMEQLAPRTGVRPRQSVAV